MYFSKPDLTAPVTFHGAVSYPIFPEGTAPCPGCNAAMNIYSYTEYPTPGVHDDNEGFFVIKGTGRAKIGDEEEAIGPGSFFYAPAHVEHVMKKDEGSEDLQVVLFHFPA